MTIAKITGPGLAAMGVSVAILWACLLGEHTLVRRASLQRARALYEIELLRQKHRAEPVTEPVLPPIRPQRAAAG